MGLLLEMNNPSYCISFMLARIGCANTLFGKATQWMRRRRMCSRQAVNPFSLAARTFSSPWSQYPPKVGSPTLKPEKAPLVQMFLCSSYHLRP
ncbi:uncharacterized protein LOC101939251 isoform X2 [Chrysemys picta bellii]